MNALVQAAPPVLPNWEPKSPFDLVIAYQNASSRDQAARLYRRLYEDLSGEYDFQTWWWGLADLWDMPWREQAADAAARSDMILLSLSHGQELPPYTKVWIEAWLARKEERPSALVVLVQQCPRTPQAIWPVRYYLQGIARLGRMDFFFHAAETTPDLPHSLQAIRERAQKMTPALTESMRPRFAVPKLY